MKKIYAFIVPMFLVLGIYAQEEYVIPHAIVGTCTTPDSNLVTIFIDYNQNCAEADPTGILAGQEELAMHSGANAWAVTVEWDAENALTAKNIGNDIFMVQINTMEYYGLPLTDIENIRFILNNGVADPGDAWAVAIRDDQGGGGFGGTDPCNDFELQIAALPTCAELAVESSVSLFGATTAANSCVDTVGGNVTIQFDLSLNCPESDSTNMLAGATALGFHSGANDWAVQMDWDGEGAMQAVNNGNDIFSVTFNVMDYYGIPMDSLTNIKLVMNNGIALPNNPWDATGRDDRDGGFGGAEPCSDLLFVASEAPVCIVETEVISSAALLSSTGDLASCVDPATGRARISFDLSMNCPESDSTLVLAGATALGFHSGANQWASQVMWDDSTAMSAVNNGSDIFSVTVDIAQYYGIEFDSLTNIIMVMNNGIAAPESAWDATGRDDRDAESFGSLNPCSDLVFQVSEMPTCDLADEPEVLTSPALLSEVAGSCMDRNLGLLRIGFDQSMNCPEADSAGVLAGLDAIGFHSGANEWNPVVAWDDEGSKQAKNEGNNVFSVVIDPSAYYGLPLDSIEFISFLYNNGVANPDDPWGITGKDIGAGGFGGGDPCKNLNLQLSELPGCDLSETATSHALFNGSAASCVDTTSGSITLQFDYNFNCPEADSAKLLAGQEMIAFHSGINDWAIQVPWDDANAIAGVNDGNDVFSLTIDPMAYYGVPLDSVQEINFLFNNGLAAPGAAWDNKGEDARDGSGFGGSPCSNLLFKTSEAPVCSQSTSVKSLALDKNLKVIPNPFSDRVQLQFDNPNNESFDLVIINMAGQVIKNIRNIQSNQLIVERGNMSPGMYFARLMNQKGQFQSVKMVVK